MLKSRATGNGGGLPPTLGLRIAGAQAVALGLLVGLLYFGILVRLVHNWWNDPDFSHGFLIPVFAGYVVWQRWGRLRELPIKPAWLGLGVVVGALGLLVVGVLGAELFLSRSSLIFLLAGLVIYFLSWRHFRAVMFPILCLFFMIPIPAIIFNHITFPLQLLASKVASSSLSFAGVPVLREGNVLQLPGMSLEVAEACSGIRSLMSLGALAIIYGYFLEPCVRNRLLLLAAAIPIAVLANSTRIVGTGLLVEYWDAEKAEGLLHAFTGWVAFVLGMGMLFGLHKLMGLSDKPRSRGPA